MTEVAAGVEVPQPGDEPDSNISRTRAVTPHRDQQMPQPHDQTDHGRGEHRRHPAQHLVMMPARAYGLLRPVTAAATAAPEPIRSARSV